MLLHNDNLVLYFGTAEDKLQPYQNNPEVAFLSLIHRLGLASLVVSRQTHGVGARVIDAHHSLNRPLDFFTQEGDILLTNQKNIALGVITGDCVPVIMHDSKNHAVAVVHAGWRGSFAGAAERALELMQQSFGTQAPNITVFIGPAGKPCCYQVGPEFIEMLGYQAVDDGVLIQRDNTWYCDVARMNQVQLTNKGVPPQQISVSPVCTICTPNYCSHRRLKELAGRQISFAYLR